MGTGSSKISGDQYLLTRTRDKLLEATSSSRSFMDSIFLYLKDELRLESYINLLGSDSQCEKFIFVLASQLGEVFERLPISVEKGKKDWILFQTTEELTKKPQSKQFTKQYCQYIARFIVRIFQVYAALSLSVLDNDAIRDMTNDPDIMRIVGQLPVGAMGIRRGLRPAQRGGDKTINDMIFNKFKQIILTRFSLIKDNPNFNVKYEDMLFNIEYTIDRENALVVKVNAIGTSSGPIDGDLLAKLKGGRHHFLQIIKPVYVIDDKLIDNNIQSIIGKTIELFNNIIKRIKTDAGIQDQYLAGQRGRLGVGFGQGLQSTSSSQPFAALKSVPRPTPHCVTRGLQLLSFSAGMKSPRTAICSKQFMKTTPGSSTPALKAFIDLFFDVHRKSDSRPLPGAEQKYAEMLKLFPDAKLASIKDCLKSDGIYSIKPEATSQINEAIEAVKKMWEYQGKHTADVAKFMTALFDIKKQGNSWVVQGINKQLYDLGPEFLETKLAPKARELLIDYYSKCEEIYTKSRLELLRYLQY